MPPKKSIILYADDDPDDLQMVEEAFSNYNKNIEMITCRHGLEALRYLEETAFSSTRPCLIILDINMPVINGKETLKELRSMGPYKDIPVVLFSTSSHPNDKEFALRYNAVFITKPIHGRQMQQILDDLIGHCEEAAVKQHLKARKH